MLWEELPGAGGISGRRKGLRMNFFFLVDGVSFAETSGPEVFSGDVVVLLLS